MYEIQHTFMFALVVTSSAFAQQATFEGLGNLPGEFFDNVVTNVAENDVVIGSIEYDSGVVGYRWEAGQITELSGFPKGLREVNPVAASANASVIVGHVVTEDHSIHGFRWTEEEVLIIEPAEDSSWLRVTGVSGDGAVLVGSLEIELESNAFVWQDGEIELLPPLSSGFTIADGISSDGQRIIGTSANPGVGPMQSVMWVNGQPQGLGFISNHFVLFSRTHGMSGNAEHVVGESSGEYDIREPFRWSDGEMSTLWATNDETWMYPEDVSNSGELIIAGPYLWDLHNGNRWLDDVLESHYCIDLDGWDVWAEAVTDSGRTIVGSGINPDDQQEGWIFKYEPEDCVFEFADVADFTGALAGPSSEDSPACPCFDFDKDGSVSLADFALFQVEFETCLP